MKFLYKCILILLCLGSLSFLATYFAISHGYFVLNWDGYIHFTRFESIYQSLHQWELPTLVNLMGFGNVGQAFTAMYPWIGSIFFIFPRFIFENPIIAVAVGFMLVNFITITNFYILSRELTQNILFRIFGSVLYTFGTYHFILLYTREAMGESFAYMFMPLALTGCIRIWKRNYKYSWIFIGLGAGMVINSHLISTLLLACVMVGTELVRLILRKINLQEILSFFKAACLSFIIGCYSIINILFIEINNKLASIWKGLLTNSADNMWNNMLSNAIQEHDAAFTLGIINFIILVITFIVTLKRKKTNSIPYVYSSIILLFIVFGWIPVYCLSNTIFANIQFLGRLLCLISLFISVAITIQLDELGELVNKVAVMLGIFLTITVSVSALDNWHRNYSTIDSSQVIVKLDSQNYFNETIYKNWKLSDYLPRNISQDIVDNKYSDITITNSTVNSLTGKIKVDNSGLYKLDFTVYKGIPYIFKVNDKRVTNFGQNGELKLKLKSGNNKIYIETKIPTFCYLTFLVSIISIVMSSAYLMFKYLKKVF